MDNELRTNAINFLQKSVKGYLKLTFKEIKQERNWGPLTSADFGTTCSDLHEVLYQPFYHCESNDRIDYTVFANAWKGHLDAQELKDFQAWLDEVEDEELDEVAEIVIKKTTSYAKKRIKDFIKANSDITDGLDIVYEILEEAA